MNSIQLAAYIDHTLLRADATYQDIERLCVEAGENCFFSVCVNGCWIQQARQMLKGSDIRVVSVAGFPLGAMSLEAKRCETELAINCGAQEIDVVLNIGHLKQRDDRYVSHEMSEIVRAAAGMPVKFILETCLLNAEEKVRACLLATDSGARFVKTSTGFGSGGATVADVKLLRQSVGAKVGIKASGSIRDAETAIAMIEAGATRLGTSASVSIIKGLKALDGSAC